MFVMRARVSDGAVVVVMLQQEERNCRAISLFFRNMAPQVRHRLLQAQY